MSKEQTPIEQILRTTLVIDNQKGIKYAVEKLEAHFNAKVLEALESDLKDLSDCYKAHAEDNPRKEVCQVLHTLIMEKQEQIAQTKQK
jgi:hypothetical protein